MPDEPEEQAKVVDLLAALEASVEAAKKAKSARKKPARKAS
jgi:non-homologous end joining protein Ku